MSVNASREIVRGLVGEVESRRVRMFDSDQRSVAFAMASVYCGHWVSPWKARNRMDGELGLPASAFAYATAKELE